MTVHSSSQAGGPERWAAEVMGALERLDAPYRQALRLIYWNGMTQAQVAAELAVPEQTVRAHVARGMRMIAASLTRSGSA